ncbi:hypothetical protein AZC_0092 [Azorhizobium caulinodans ORS 571]|uniref:DUF2267 domain-containing protein n=1 Tax=Azorhizobium caulinodans (strain ATCC 43989 / DSM 5975 / JCM 20966 / LMG 6465 / NBRC 14845 / NCIMB 13405 / ORS 571) TaxID=438753 RepID=A8IGI4_AZOC5|nr:DUF2267 domain-containing protein [Azorhizobium caulinodans]BAF86090.1 hypothetical protein AZC_0092 [Azorhizobium caulinodans ORS 571]
MPMPMEYQHASEEFERFLADARDTAGLGTRNQTYTVVQSVLLTFRRRLDVHQAIRFAQVLPPVLRAIFIADWDTTVPPVPFTDRETLAREVQALRPHHNFATAASITDVATALRRHVDMAKFKAVLARLPEGAAAFWHVADPERT